MKDVPFNKLVVFDEAHKYIENDDLVSGLVEVVREMRHKVMNPDRGMVASPWRHASSPSNTEIRRAITESCYRYLFPCHQAPKRSSKCS